MIGAHECLRHLVVGDVGAARLRQFLVGGAAVLGELVGKFSLPASGMLALGR